MSDLRFRPGGRRRQRLARICRQRFRNFRIGDGRVAGRRRDSRHARKRGVRPDRPGIRRITAVRSRLVVADLAPGPGDGQFRPARPRAMDHRSKRGQDYSPILRSGLQPDARRVFPGRTGPLRGHAHREHFAPQSSSRIQIPGRSIQRQIERIRHKNANVRDGGFGTRRGRSVRRVGPWRRRRHALDCGNHFRTGLADQATCCAVESADGDPRPFQSSDCPPVHLPAR